MLGGIRVIDADAVFVWMGLNLRAEDHSFPET
jgi:hypothetical protein